jgi:hypothetical protein
LTQKTLSIQVQNAQVELDDAKDDMEKLTNNAEATTSAVTELVKAQQELDDAQKAYGQPGSFPRMDGCRSTGIRDLFESSK